MTITHIADVTFQSSSTFQKEKKRKSPSHKKSRGVEVYWISARLSDLLVLCGNPSILSLLSVNIFE
jgi:hypothetical protein